MGGMKKTLLETYRHTYSQGCKPAVIRVYHVVSDRDATFTAESNYRRIHCSGESIDEAKSKCEGLIDLKHAILTGQLHLISTKEADQLAKEDFQRYITQFNLKDEINERMIISMWLDGKLYYVEIGIFDHPLNQSFNGLIDDLDGQFPETLFEMIVDRETREVRIIPNDEVVRKVFGQIE